MKCNKYLAPRYILISTEEKILKAARRKNTLPTKEKL